MRKRALSLLLVACMVVGLLPTVALAETVTDYNIWVGGTRVTSANKDGITGEGISGSVTYDPSSNTITMNDATITGYYIYDPSAADISTGIYSSEDINIVLIGSNYINFKPSGRGGGIYSEKNISLSGNGSIAVTLDNSGPWQGAIMANGSYMNITGCTVIATSGDVSDSSGSFGLHIPNGIVNITDAIVTVTAGDAPIYVICRSWGIRASEVNITNSKVISGAYGTAFYVGTSGTIAVSDSKVTASTDRTGIGATIVSVSDLKDNQDSYKYVKISRVPTDAQAVAAAKEAIVNGSVNVDFGASQDAKTAAVQAYVNTLLTEDAEGVTATVTLTSGNEYSVALSKGSANDNTSITMTINEAPEADPEDISIVDNAKTAAQNATYADMTQVALTSLDDVTRVDVIKAALKSTAEEAINNSGVSVNINEISITLPTAGTSTNPSGTNGSYVFTVTVSKGSAKQTTTEKTITITAKGYYEAQWGNAGADGSAPTTWTKGTLIEAFDYANGNTNSGVTPYIQLLSDVNTETTLFIAQDRGVFQDHYSAILDLNGYYIDRGLSNSAPEYDSYKGSVIRVRYNTTLTLKDSSTNNVADQGKITGGNTTRYGGGIYVEGKLIMLGGNITGNKSSLGGGGVYVTKELRHKIDFGFEMKGGAITNNQVPNNIDGSGVWLESFADSYWENEVKYYYPTLTMTGGIITGNIGNSAVYSKKVIINIGGKVVINDNFTTGDKKVESNVRSEKYYYSVFGIVEPLLSGTAIGINQNCDPANPQAIEITDIQPVDYSSFFFSDNANYYIDTKPDTGPDQIIVRLVPSPDITTVYNAKTAAQKATYANMTQGAATSVDVIKAALKSTAEKAINNSGVAVSINQISYTEPEAGTSADTDGTNGSYVFSVSVSKGEIALTTAEKTIIITATQYAALLTEAKTAAKAELAAYKNASDYTTNAAAFESAISAGNTAIDGAATTEAIATALDDAKHAIDEIKTDAALLAEATEAVVKAESSKLQADVDAAQALVTALPDGGTKTALQGRIAVVQGTIDEAKASAVDTLITALPAAGTVAIGDKAEIEAARTAYNALTAAQQALVADVAALEAAEAELAVLEANQEAADEVDALIAALPAAGTVAIGDKAEIEAARTAYNALTAAQQALVANVAALEAAEAELAVLGTYADWTAAGAAAVLNIDYQINGDTYTVITPKGLAKIANIVNGTGGETANDLAGKTVVLANDINLADRTVISYGMTSSDGTISFNNSWKPIGDNGKFFAGTFNGNRKIIRNLKIGFAANVGDEGVTYGQGLFGQNKGIIKNVGVVGGYVIPRLVTNEAAYRNYVGGITGYNHGGTVINCYNTATITGRVFVGGLVGYNYGGPIINSYNTGTVTMH